MVACSKIVLLATGAAALVAPPALQERQATALAASKPSLPGPGSHHTPRDNKGSFSTLGAAAAAEPYAVSSPQASVAWPEVAKDQEVTRI